MLELVMFSCINVSFDIIEYKFVFVRSPCFKCSFCPRRFTTIIYSAPLRTHPPQCRINLDNRVLLVFCVDLLKTKFSISLSELQVDHRFLLLNEYLLFRLKFSSVKPVGNE